MHSIDMGGFEGAWLSEGTDGEMINDLWYWKAPGEGGDWVTRVREYRKEGVDVSDITPRSTHIPFEDSQARGAAKGYYMPVYDYAVHATFGTGSETKPRNIVMNVIIKVK